MLWITTDQIFFRVKHINLVFNYTTVIDLNAEEAPDLFKTVDFLLLLNGTVLEPHSIYFRLRDRFRELSPFFVLIHVRLHASLEVLVIVR